MLPRWVFHSLATWFRIQQKNKKELCGFTWPEAGEGPGPRGGVPCCSLSLS